MMARLTRPNRPSTRCGPSRGGARPCALANAAPQVKVAEACAAATPAFDTVFMVHNETTTGVVNDVAAVKVRRAPRVARRAAHRPRCCRPC